MYLPNEINKIKDQRRRKRMGIDDDSEFNVNDDTSYDDNGGDVEKSEVTEQNNEKKDEQHDLGKDEIPIEPFNMRQEMAEGAFDTDGTYLERDRKMTSTNRSLNRDEGDDPWILSLEEQEALADKGDYSSFYKKRPRRADDSKPDLVQQLEGTPTVDVIKRLIKLLEPGETPVDALKLPNKRKNKPTLPGFRKKTQDEPTSTDNVKTNEEGDEPKEVPENKEEKTVLSKMDISDLTHVLTVTWQNVYYMTKEEIRGSLANAMKRWKRGTADAEIGKKYQFRWVRGSGDVHGPNSEQEIFNWIAFDYISDANPIEMREVGKDGKPLKEEWVNYKDTELYNFLNPGYQKASAVEQGTKQQENEENEETNKDAEGGSTDDDDVDDGTFSKKQRKNELIGIKPKKSMPDEDSQGSDDEPDVE
ncbi:uncharacterized protein BXIN_1383 [Babesia sp. Xinjiang]|uniref:uncharacterized protein n=1 Tax=Babesia sp. Xinjiang TaxID=462227 RepID=UPI000A23105B|nr:uncharacterized protein BXIN_1383 [Babesia sp. Xinjiang]ORM39946.1 hypothetical protein BXIN_1383 [Babesia sp. Xinjiang]